MDQLVTEQTFRKYEKYFWCAYILLPLFTGFLNYNWLPNESYDERKHEQLSSRIVDTNPVGGSEEVAKMWRSKTSDRIYSREAFSEHRHTEAARMSVTTFLYGLIGCFFFAYGQEIKKQGNFVSEIKVALLYDTAAAIMIIFLIW